VLFLNPNEVKQMLMRGETAYGTWVTIGNPEIAEILANAGFDWLVFDTEHAPLSLETIEWMMQATAASRIVPFVRVARNDMVMIKRALDIGAYGVVVPLVNNKEDAERAVSYARYPPRGVRGVGPRRCSAYGIRANEYFEWAEKEIMTIIQIETGEAVENIENMLTVDGVDAVFLGPTDLSTSLGVRGKLDHPKFTEALERVVKAASACGVPAGIMAYTAEQAHEARQRGFKIISLASDFRLLIQGAKAMLAGAGN
jgi:2-dehydro-3-deoxyglucarate aldolase